MIIIVDTSYWAGLVVRWYLTDKPEDCGEMVQPDLSASREGVMVGTFLHRVEGSLLDHAKSLHASMAEGDPEKLKQIRLAIPTHVRVSGGIPVAVGSPTPEERLPARRRGRPVARDFGPDYDDRGRWIRTDRPELLSDLLGYPAEVGDENWKRMQHAYSETVHAQQCGHGTNPETKPS